MSHKTDITFAGSGCPVEDGPHFLTGNKQRHGKNVDATICKKKKEEKLSSRKASEARGMKHKSRGRFHVRRGVARVRDNLTKTDMESGFYTASSEPTLKPFMRLLTASCS